MSDLAQWKVHGPVRSLKTEFAAWDLATEEWGAPRQTGRTDIQHTRFEYQYDAEGNWAERIVWGRLDPNPNFERSNLERREIGYHTPV